jgi:hypothetical protein
MKKLILVLPLFFTLHVFGQVTFQFIPELYGRSVDALLNCRIINLSGRKSGSLTLTVSERKHGAILTVRTAPFNLGPGVNALPLAAVRTSSVEFFVNQIAVLVKQDHYFPAGDYEYCFTMNFSGGSDAPAEQCFIYNLVPFAELHLIEPYDRDTLCDKKPMLTWQPLIPTINGTSYQVVLSEIKKDQNAIEALEYNLPIVNQSYLTSPVLIYPPIARQLEDGKTYAWQVTAYKNQTILSRSEIWQFKVQCHEKKPVVLNEDGYRDIEDLTRGNYYLAVGTIKFALTNPYKEGNFKYQIESLNNPGKKIRGLPRVRLTTGKNKILIDLANTDAFTDGSSYLMKLWLPNGDVKNLRFIYKD